MSSVTITPWVNRAELLEVRALLYPRDIDDKTEQKRQKRLGVDIVSLILPRITAPRKIEVGGFSSN
jgi:hypothetical protein